MSPHSLKTRISGILCALTLFLVCSFSSLPRLLADNHILYVNDNASGSNDGSSWANAYTKLQDALAAATAGDEIWVAAGVYYPDEGAGFVNNDTTVSFALKSGVTLYGGFAGTESELSQRDFATNLTVLSGDIDQSDKADANHIVNDVADIDGINAYHPVSAWYVDSSARLDGFVLTAGAADKDSTFCPAGCGGGIYAYASSPALANLTVVGNRATYGAGMVFLGLEASTPTLTDSTITKNYAVKFGGGLQTQDGAEITITRVKFLSNSSNDVGGGARIYNVDATLNDVTFQDNTSYGNGGGIYVTGGPNVAKVTINQALFDNNYATVNGGAIYADGGSLQLQNARFEKNISSTEAGAGIFGQNTTMNIKQSDFEGNSAKVSGGAIASINDNSETKITLTDVTMTLNSTRESGGALSQSGGKLSVLRVVFSRNTTYAIGGGALLNSVDTLMSNVQFLGNYAAPPNATDAGDGGAMYISGSELTASNIIFSGNYSTRVGALYLLDGTIAQLYHATFTDNSFNPGVSGPQTTKGIFVLESNLLLSNSIMWGTPSATMVRAFDATATIRYSLFEHTDAPADSNGNITTQTSPFRTNPSPGDDGFGNDPSTEEDESANDNYGDLRLKSSARAIDAGSNGDVPADFADVDGDSDVAEDLPQDIIGALRKARFIAAEANVDMGAYEYQNTAPTLVMAGPFTLDEGESIALDATGSMDDGSIVGYDWDCTNNGSTDVSETSPNTGACVYPDSGNYTLRLTLRDNLDATRTATTTVTVANVAPTYTPAGNQTAVAGNAQSIDLGSFVDPGAEGVWNVTVNWGGETTEFTTDEVGTLPARIHTYATAGTFNVVVTIRDGESDETNSFQVTVSAPPPGAPVVTAPASQQATPGGEQMFSLGSFTDGGSGGPWQVTVTWGDGSADTTFEMTSSGQLPDQPHTYGEAGEYEVLVTVSDGALLTTMTFNVTIDEQPQEEGATILLPLTRK